MVFNLKFLLLKFKGAKFYFIKMCYFFLPVDICVMTLVGRYGGITISYSNSFYSFKGGYFKSKSWIMQELISNLVPWSKHFMKPSLILYE